MKASQTARVAGRSLFCGLAVLMVALTFAASASAAGSATITMSPTSPDVGDAVTFTDSTPTDCAQTYTWTVDGTQLPPQNSPSITQTFSTAGNHTVSVSANAGNCGYYQGSLTFMVQAALAGSISVSPDPPIVNQSATLSASQTGGTLPYTYAWDTDNNGSFGNGSTRTVTTTFTTTGSHVVRVKIDDNAGHETIVTRTLNVQPQSSATPPPPPPPCVKQLAFQLYEFTTPGCFQQVGSTPSAQWTTTAAVTLNGIPFPDYGQTFTITFPTSSQPGRFTAPNSAIQLGSFVAFAGNVNWTLPNGVQGEEKDVTSFTVATGAQLFGLSVRGSIGLKLGWDSSGKHYATFPLTIQLPAGFTAGPDPSFGSVTGSASLRVDDDGIHYDGLKLQAANVWIGKLKVDEACFSFVPSGGQSVAPCAAPSLDGTPYLTCATDVNTNRWNGNAVIELPSSGVQLAAFGGLANGQVSELGGFVDNLGRRLPIAPNVYLDRIGVGLCLTPPPLQLRGDVGIAIFPTTGDEALAKIDGHVTYTDSYPWKLEIGGTVKALDTQIGTGSVTLNGWGGVAFQLAASMDLYGVASLSGQINGWVDPPSNQYAVSGSVHACISILGCAEGSAVVSNLGVAGCITITSTIQSPDLIITLGDPPTIGFDTRTLYLTAGVGYRWGASWPDIFGGSCDLSPYTPTRPFARDARAGEISQRVAPNTAALSWRIHGTHGPPKIVIRGPHGTTITSSARAAEQSKGHWMLVENPANGTTNVLLIHPAAGTWTVNGIGGGASAPTTIDQAAAEVPPTLAAGVRGTGPTRTLEMAYAVPVGASVRLVERGKGINRTLVRAVRGHRCAGKLPAKRPGSDQEILCFNLRFHPAPGPGGVRKIQAVVVSRAGMPMLQKDIASFRAPRLRLPTRPRYLLARRANGTLRVAFMPSSGASHYLVSASLSDGRELAFELGPRCQAVLIKRVPRGVSAKVKVAGMRLDLAMGAPRTLSIKGGAASAGPKGKLPLRLRKPRRICS